MSHPIYWPGKTYYYPIGNTSPVYLLQDLAPEEKAEVLLLGCGDARNILFSLYTRGKATIHAPIDITCCDAEPAVLARNIILFTLLVDHDAEEIQEKLWNIFFHLYLDQDAYNLLNVHCAKLIECSESLDGWRQGPYSSFLSFCSHDTLEKIRQIWQTYAQSATLSPKKRTEMMQDYRQGINTIMNQLGNKKVLSAVRSAGPTFVHGISLLGETSQFYWKTGTADPHLRQLEPGSKIVNPTLYYSSRAGFNLHYGTSPLQAFHLARAFTPLQAESGVSLDSGSESDIKSVAADAYKQFGDWCIATRSILLQKDSKPQMKLRFFVGDALAFCFALEAYSSGTRASGQLVKPWSNAEIILDDDGYLPSAQSPAPAAFNVIDTSNLADHLGLLNLLTAVLPLLSRTPSSTLYTETLLRGAGGGDFTQGFLDSLCMDISVFQVLFGISPSGSCFHLTSHSNTHEVLIHRLIAEKNPQYHERISWKDAIGSTPILKGYTIDLPRPVPIFEPTDLAALLLNIYHKVFTEEDISVRLANKDFHSIRMFDLVHYVRGSFAALLLVARRRLGLTSAEWDETMNLFLDQVQDDQRLMMGMNYFQDFCCQLYLHGLLDLEKLSRQWTMAMDQDKSTGRFSRWKTVPLVARVVMVIPRSHLSKVDNLLSRSTPCLQCDVKGENEWRSMFSSLTVCFGRVISSPGDDGKGKIVIEEDFSGIEGSSAMITSFWMPTSMLLGRQPVATSFGLSLRSTATSFHMFGRKLGEDMRLFSADINDKNHVYFSQELPLWASPYSNDTRSNISHPDPADSQSVARVTLDKTFSRITFFTIRFDITDPAQKSALQDGVVVTSEQVSACEIVAHLSKHQLACVFPYPVNGPNVLLRVARKSSYIEVVAPVWKPTSTAWKGKINRFPIIRPQSNVFSTWNLHHVVLDSLPILDFSVSKERLTWYNVHPTLAFSERETSIRLSAAHSANPDGFDALLNVKDSIHALLIQFTGLQSNTRISIFGLNSPGEGGNYTLIFVNGVRLDLASHTVVADAFVFPLTLALLENPVILQTLSRLSGIGLMTIKTSPGEVIAWKQLLPAFVERCRQWRHRDTCEYLAQGCVPLSTELVENPICTCGQGQDKGMFMKKFKEWKSLAPYVTRAAISPIFAVSYLESVATDASKVVTSPSLSLPGNARGQGLADATGSDISARSIPAGAIGECCAKCGAQGKPKLLVCSRCKKIKYCSALCQKADWKRHKPLCT